MASITASVKSCFNVDVSTKRWRGRGCDSLSSSVILQSTSIKLIPENLFVLKQPKESCSTLIVSRTRSRFRLLSILGFHSTDTNHRSYKRRIGSTDSEILANFGDPIRSIRAPRDSRRVSVSDFRRREIHGTQEVCRSRIQEDCIG